MPRMVIVFQLSVTVTDPDVARQSRPPDRHVITRRSRPQNDVLKLRKNKNVSRNISSLLRSQWLTNLKSSDPWRMYHISDI